MPNCREILAGDFTLSVPEAESDRFQRWSVDGVQPK